MEYKEPRKENGAKKFLKDYFGVVPLLGGVMTGGIVCGAAFVIGLASESYKQFVYAANGGAVFDSISMLYQHAGNLAGQWVMPAEFAGQLLTYKFKKSVASIFKK